MRAFARWTTPDEVELWFPYDPTRVEDFKRAIRPRSRRWDADRKLWVVRWPDARAAFDLLLSWHPNAEVYGTGGKPPPKEQDVPNDPYAVLHLRTTAPRGVVDAAYRALARLTHPDLGGDGEAMKRVNAAYERIKERLA